PTTVALRGASAQVGSRVPRAVHAREERRAALAEARSPSPLFSGTRTASAGATSLSAACSDGPRRPRTARRRRATPRPLASAGPAERSRPPDPPRGRLAVGGRGPTPGRHNRGGPPPAPPRDDKPTRPGAQRS